MGGYYEGLRLDGIAPSSVKKPRILERDPEETPLPEDEEDDLMYVLLAENDEFVYLAGKGKPGDIIEKRLSPEERKEFDRAKDEALMPWIENMAWEPADSSEADPGECCPIRFLLKWKVKDGVRKANARISGSPMRGLGQGGLLPDVGASSFILNIVLDREDCGPTLLGRVCHGSITSWGVLGTTCSTWAPGVPGLHETRWEREANGGGDRGRMG